MPKMPLALVKLSSGYDVQIDFGRFDKDMEHLTNALIGEIFLPALKKGNLKKAAQQLQHEIITACEKMSSKTKSALLTTIMWHRVCEKHSKLMKMLRLERSRKQNTGSRRNK